MKNLSGLAGEILFIHQPSIWKNFYELKNGDEVLGTIRAPRVFSFAMLFKMGNSEWEIYRPSFWKSEVAVRQAGYEMPYATYKQKAFKKSGVVELFKGERFIIEYKLFKGGYNIQNTSGEYLVTFTEKVSFKDRTEFQIEKKSELLDKYPWVVALAWYISQQKKHAGAAAAG